MSEHGVVTEPGTIRFERLLPGPIERVWAYLTEADKRRQWFAGGEMELRAGGKADLLFRHAELMSPGTTTWRASSSGWPVRVTVRAPSAVASTVISAPKWRSISSVWSRLGAGSITWVWPGAPSPASSTADFTWAEATGSR